MIVYLLVDFAATIVIATVSFGAGVLAAATLERRYDANRLPRATAKERK